MLRNNYQQTLALSLAERRGLEDLGFQQRLMQTLEARGLLDRAVEFLPDDVELAERRAPRAGADAAGAGGAARLCQARAPRRSARIRRCRTIPIWRASSAAISRRRSRERFPDALEQHRLRREIIATQLANSMINRGGPTVVVRIADQTGASPAGIAAAFAAVRDSFDLIALNGEIDALDNKIAGELQLELYAAVQDLLLDRLVWFLRNVDLAQGLAGDRRALPRRHRGGGGRARRRAAGGRGGARAPRASPELGARRRARRAGAPHRRSAGAGARRPTSCWSPTAPGKPVAEVAATYFAAERVLPARPHRRRRRAASSLSDYFDRLALDRALDSIGDAERRLDRRDGGERRRRRRRRSKPGCKPRGARSSASARRCTRSPPRG